MQRKIDGTRDHHAKQKPGSGRKISYFLSYGELIFSIDIQRHANKSETIWGKAGASRRTSRERGYRKNMGKGHNVLE